MACKGREAVEASQGTHAAVSPLCCDSSSSTSGGGSGLRQEVLAIHSDPNARQRDHLEGFARAHLRPRQPGAPPVEITSSPTATPKTFPSFPKSPVGTGECGECSRPGWATTTSFAPEAFG